MPQHDDTSCSCPRGGHIDFDSICRRELADSISADAIINRSGFCTSFQLNMIPDEDQNSLTLRDYLYGLNRKIGIYHIWVEEDYCYEHKRYSMLCVYVGKGEALTRMLVHAKSRLPDNAFFAVSFFECENRIAKYLEQLFLDVYTFHLNENENSGERYLYASWDEQRREIGTELHNVANRSTPETGDDPSH